MKKCNRWIFIPTTLAVFLAAMGATKSNAQVLEIAPQLQPDPLVVNGTSGGSQGSECGNIAGAPNQVIDIKQPFPYLRFNAQSAGEATLLIVGPGGRRDCGRADSPGGNAEVSGFWEAGTYSVFVGDRTQGQHPYTLSISQQQ